MKTLFASILLSSLFVTALASNSPEEVTAKNPTVLVVGFEKSKLVSNYYGNDYLSNEIGIDQDSLHHFYFASILENLKAQNPINFRPITDQQDLAQFYNAYRISSDEISEIPTDVPIVDLLETNNSDYLLYINQYEINWSGEPFNTNVHLMRYSLIDRERNEVLSEQVFFNSESLQPMFSQKKAERRLKQLSQKIERAVK